MMRTKRSLWVAGLLASLLSGEAVSGRIVPRRDARQGVLDAQLVVIVSQRAGEEYQIEEVFWGDARVGDSLLLPDFRLATKQGFSPDLIDPISANTRILLFLRHKAGGSNTWEPTDHGYCYFWAQEPGRVFELRAIAQQAVGLRKRWEDAASIPDPQKRVEALWPFLRLMEYGPEFFRRTREELRRIGPVAGDYFAEHFYSKVVWIALCSIMRRGTTTAKSCIRP